MPVMSDFRRSMLIVALLTMAAPGAGAQPESLSRQERLYGKATKSVNLFRINRAPAPPAPGATTDFPLPQSDYYHQLNAAFASPPAASNAALAPGFQLEASQKDAAGGPIWAQSRDGGYFDASGKIHTVIPGDELYKYGGRFLDGRPAPTGPCVINAAKHVYFSNGMPVPRR